MQQTARGVNVRTMSTAENLMPYNSCSRKHQRRDGFSSWGSERPILGLGRWNLGLVSDSEGKMGWQSGL